jgi:cellulose synthase/poly-beta-1,6-N-acetylglucosamine synthase-like glycosyltransferase
MGNELGAGRVARTAAMTTLLDVCSWLLFAIVATLVVYTVRHYLFTVNRLFGRQRHPYVDVELARWPLITVCIAAHNEEQVVEHAIPLNDRSTDRTAEILDNYNAFYPNLIRPIHRAEGTPGKAAALCDAMPHVRGEILIVFDADYLPGKSLLRQLVAPFFDPQVGAVMGRVVPLNVGTNLLTRMLDLERSAGYQVDQQARMNLRLVPQYGGTVGGVRIRALENCGGWRADTLTEDTDLTYRLLLCGWETVYQNRSECYEEVPEQWPVRVRQITRWSDGHNQAMRDYAFAVLRDGYLNFWQRIDGFLLLGVYAVASMTLAGWVLTLMLWYGGRSVAGFSAVLVVASYNTMGNFASFFEVASAARLDGYSRRVRLLPLLLVGYLVTLIAVLRGLLPGRRSRGGGGPSTVIWHKTRRFRHETAAIL